MISINNYCKANFDFFTPTFLCVVAIQKLFPLPTAKSVRLEKVFLMLDVAAAHMYEYEKYMNRMYKQCIPYFFLPSHS